jgi:hypothetical protein
MEYLGSAGPDSGRNPLGKYQCKCKNIFISRIWDVENGHTNSCGCYKVEQLKRRHKSELQSKKN